MKSDVKNIFGHDNRKELTYSDLMAYDRHTFLSYPDYSKPACCDQQHEVTSEQICSMLPDITAEFEHLCKRHKQMTTRNKRLRRLSRPRSMTMKFIQSCPCRDSSKRVEIVRKESPMHTRTEQLSYPQVSKLLSLKRHPSYLSFETKRKEKVNLLIHKSLHSLYSRLSNTQPPRPPRKKARKWSEDDWLVHKHYMSLLSKPKRISKSTPGVVKAGEKTGRSLKRLSRLANPKRRPEVKPPKWELTDGMRYYEPSKRLLKLAKPILRPSIPYDPNEIKPTALTHIATLRTNQLAVAPARLYKAQDQRSNPFMISPSALKAKTSKRLIDLSAPRYFPDNHVRTNPFKVARRALHFNITKRLKELAQPKVYSASTGIYVSPNPRP